MAENKEEVPKGATWTLTLPLDRENENKAVFYLKDMDLDLYMGLQTLIEARKFADVITTCISSLRVGGDQVDKIKGNFFAMQTADGLIREMLRPVPGELKKN